MVKVSKKEMHTISNIKLALEEVGPITLSFEPSEGYLENLRELLKKKIQKKLRDTNLSIEELEVIKESVDARDKSHIFMVYTVDFILDSKINKSRLKRLFSQGMTIAPSREYEDISLGENNLKNSPIVIGFGPCGMLAALILAERGFKPLVIERGKNIDERVKDVEKFWQQSILNEESNVQFGAGGAGTFSDGKLTTGIKDLRIRKVLEEFVLAGAPKDILYKSKAHIGTDLLRIVVKNIEKKIVNLGGEIRYSHRFEKVNLDNEGRVSGCLVKDHNQNIKYEIKTTQLILAIGHSARDTFRSLYNQGILMEQKPFSIGVRIEHPQEIIDKAQYGKVGEEIGLPPADYKLNYRCKNGRGVYTFCMCPGGKVIMAASKKNTVVTNGMSNRKRNTGTANSGLLCDVKTSDFESSSPLAGIDFQEKYEKLAYENGGFNYMPPKSTWGEFRDGEKKGLKVANSLPDFAVESIKEAMIPMGRKLKGFDMEDCVFTAAETRSSSPVRFFRDDQYRGKLNSKKEDTDEKIIEGFYPCGEGAGYAGGIISAACDGIKVAEKIINKYKPLK